MRYLAAHAGVSGPWWAHYLISWMRWWPLRFERWEFEITVRRSTASEVALVRLRLYEIGSTAVREAVVGRCRLSRIAAAVRSAALITG